MTYGQSLMETEGVVSNSLATDHNLGHEHCSERLSFLNILLSHKNEK